MPKSEITIITPLNLARVARVLAQIMADGAQVESVVVRKNEGRNDL